MAKTRRTLNPNERFGRLVTIEIAAKSPPRETWRCACDCGEIVIVRKNNLTSGNSKSCGCGHVRHGHALHGNNSPTYTVWQNMIARVNGQRGAETAKNYSDRGIGICKRWRNFDNFLEDMGARPDGMTIDRVDNDRGYECGSCGSCTVIGIKKNCRWATRKEQQRNRRANVLLRYNGLTACLSEWAERTGIRFGVLRKRIQLGWSAEKTLTTPVKKAVS